jgi:hypothetical protein
MTARQDLNAPNKGPDASKPAGGTVQPCPAENKKTVVSCGFIDKLKASAYFGGNRDQFVNLTKADIVTSDKTIPSEAQIGRKPGISVKVTPPGRATVKVKLTRQDVTGNFPAASAALSVREKALAGLTWADKEQNHETDEKGELLLDVGPEIAMQAGFKYTVEAAVADQAFVKGGNTVEVQRRIYLQPLVRYGSGEAAANTAISGAKAYYSKYKIDIQTQTKQTGTELGIVESKNLATSLDTMGGDALKATDDLKKLAPHSIAIIVGEFVDDADHQEVDFELVIPKPAHGPFPASKTLSLVKGGQGHVLVPLADGSQLVSAEATFGAKSEPIVRAEITGLSRFTQSLNVDLTNVLTKVTTEAAITLKLKLKVMRGWGVGWAYTNFPVIYVNMRDPNTDTILDPNKALALFIHEIGHKLHLVPDGTGSLPDKQAHHYPTFVHNGLGHTGPHCSTGVAAGTDLWAPAAQTAASCTMWGSLKGITTYCSECQTSLRKMDLSSGF